RTNGFDHMATNSQQEEWLGYQVISVQETPAPVYVVCPRQTGLVCYVTVPEPAVVCAYVAQVVQRAQPGLEGMAVGNAVAAGQRQLIFHSHHGEELGHCAGVPGFYRYPYRERLTMLRPVVFNEVFLWAPLQVLALVFPLREVFLATPAP